ncbi:MAG: hypothetical protein U9O98_11425 [Asgard group archaeon]|nr:hypothetical protein [Asgard group archaeon]
MLSNYISFSKPNVKDFYKKISRYRNVTKEDSYIVLAMDGETYGHHNKHLITDFLEKLFAKVQTDSDIQFVKISKLFDLFPESKNVEIIPSSWSTSKADIDNGVPYPLWNDPENRIHYLQLRILNQVMFLVHTSEQLIKERKITKESEKRYKYARESLDQGLHSCQLWWASNKPWFSSEMILIGLHQLLLSATEAIKVIIWNSKDNQLKNKTMNIINEIFDAQKEIFLMV